MTSLALFEFLKADFGSLRGNAPYEGKYLEPRDFAPLLRPLQTANRVESVPVLYYSKTCWYRGVVHLKGGAIKDKVEVSYGAKGKAKRSAMEVYELDRSLLTKHEVDRLFVRSGGGEEEEEEEEEEPKPTKTSTKPPAKPSFEEEDEAPVLFVEEESIMPPKLPAASLVKNPHSSHVASPIFNPPSKTSSILAEEEEEEEYSSSDESTPPKVSKGKKTVKVDAAPTKKKLREASIEDFLASALGDSTMGILMLEKVKTILPGLGGVGGCTEGLLCMTKEAWVDVLGEEYPQVKPSMLGVWADFVTQKLASSKVVASGAGAASASNGGGMTKQGGKRVNKEIFVLNPSFGGDVEAVKVLKQLLVFRAMFQRKPVNNWKQLNHGVEFAELIEELKPYYSVELSFYNLAYYLNVARKFFRDHGFSDPLPPHYFTDCEFSDLDKGEEVLSHINSLINEYRERLE
jgi:hypothetical protein